VLGRFAWGDFCRTSSIKNHVVFDAVFLMEYNSFGWDIVHGRGVKTRIYTDFLLVMFIKLLIVTCGNYG